jgi:hypothetical protein
MHITKTHTQLFRITQNDVFSFQRWVQTTRLIKL